MPSSSLVSRKGQVTKHVRAAEQAAKSVHGCSDRKARTSSRKAGALGGGPPPER